MTDSEEAQATFLNKYNEATVTELTATKTWEDLNNADGFRPTTADFANLLTLNRSADAQSDEGNGITEQEVKFTVVWSDGWNNEGNNSDTFTIKPAGENSDGFEVYAPNGMPWKYTLAEAVTDEGRLKLSDSQDDVRNHIYTPDRAEGNWTTLTTISDTNNNFGNLTNSITTHADFAKVWADKNGDPLTEDYLGFELSVTFELQVSMDGDRVSNLALTDGEWIPAAEAAEEYPSIEAALKANGNNGGTKTLTGHVTDDVWKNGSFTGLPSVIKVVGTDGAADQYIFLKYRVVETAVSYGEAPHQTELPVTLDDDGIT